VVQDVEGVYREGSGRPLLAQFCQKEIVSQVEIEVNLAGAVERVARNSGTSVEGQAIMVVVVPSCDIHGLPEYSDNAVPKSNNFPASKVPSKSNLL
jgi:hypothetical protein